MGKKSKASQEPKQPKGSGRREEVSQIEMLGGIISDFLREHLEFLDRMQQSAQVTEEEAAKIEDIGRRFNNLAQSYRALGEPPMEDFQRLRDLYDAASGAVNRAELVEGSVETEKEVDEDQALKEFREAWDRDFETVQKQISALRRATDEEAVAIIESLDGLLGYFQQEKDSLSSQLETEPYSEKTKMEVQRVLSEIGKYQAEYARVKHDREQLQESLKNLETNAEERRKIGEHFQESIEYFNREIDRINGLPMESDEETNVARAALDKLIVEFNAYHDNWKRRVSPILDHLDPGKWGSWGPLSRNHKTLRIRLFGGKLHEEPEGVIGFEKTMRERLAQKSRERGATQWESTLPTFLLSLDGTNLSILDARMLVGEARKDELEAIAQSFQSQEEQWKELRRLGPREENKQASTVHQLDRRMTAMRGELNALLERALQAKAPVLEQLERDWRRAVLRADIWIAGSSIEDRATQLEAFTNGELRAEDNSDLLTLVRPEHRNDILMLVGGSSGRLFKAFRQRGLRERREIEAQERKNRADLRHPRLSFLRMQEDAAYKEMASASFWKEGAAWRDRKAAMRFGVALSNEQLESLVSDVVAYRQAFEDLEARRRVIREAEDILLAGNELKGKTNTDGVRGALNVYGAKTRREKQLWRSLMDFDRWRMSKKEKGNKLRELYESFERNGSGVLRAVPNYLRPLVADWVFAREAWNIAGAHAQWVLDENPEIIPHLKGIPHVFSLPTVADGEVTPVVDAADVVDVGGAHAEVDAHVDGDDDAPVVGAFTVTIDSASESGPDAAVVFDASSPDDTSSSATPEATPAIPSAPDARQEAIMNREKEIRALLTDGMFWKPEIRAMNRANRVKSLLKKAPGARLTSNAELQPDRVEDFYYALAFTSFEDLETRMAELRAKYAAPAVSGPVISSVTPESTVSLPPSAPAPAPAPEPVPVSVEAPSSVSSPERVVVTPVVPAPERKEPATSGTRVDTSRASVATGSEAPAPRREAAPVAPRARESVPPLAPVAVVPVPALETPASAPRTSETRIETPRPTSEAVPTPEATPVHAEERVSSWAHGIRERVSRWFGGGSHETRVETPVAIPERSTREEHEAVLQTTGTVLRVAGKIFGFRAIAKIPEYFTEGFCNDSRKAALREELFSAVEDEMKEKQGSAEARHLANLKAAERVERAISTDPTKTPEQRAMMLQKVNELRNRYEERSRESLDACNKELGKLVETWVTKKTSAWSVAKEMKNSVLRALTLGGMATSEGVQGLARGVISFRERLEAVAVRDREVNLVGRVATVFRESWEETWQNMTRAETISESAVDIAQALETLNTIAGMTGVNIDAAVAPLSGLRAALAERPSPQMRERVALARLAVQEQVDRLLPNIARRARR